MANESPATVILFEAPSAVCVKSVETCCFDSVVFVELVAAESGESCELLFTLVAGMNGLWVFCVACVLCCFDACKLCLLLYERKLILGLLCDCVVLAAKFSGVLDSSFESVRLFLELL